MNKRFLFAALAVLLVVGLVSANAEITNMTSAVEDLGDNVKAGLNALVTLVAAIVGIGATIWGIGYIWKKIRGGASKA